MSSVSSSSSKPSSLSTSGRKWSPSIILDYFEPKCKRGHPRGLRKVKEKSVKFVTEKTMRTKPSSEKVEKSQATVSVNPHDAGLLAMLIAASIHDHNGGGKSAGDAIKVVNDEDFDEDAGIIISLLPEMKKTI
eukprot:13119367-Ditylum_brightwellii.AAC.1